ncbi:PAS domain-containing protein [Tepidicaulis sp. LMO-SS28]|uniref:PAS domain-containing protein n=1 Tax=Tepidicaulis sp. LMO-SS28 TaxID=3447455 RepID=UPI003EE0541D
MRLDQAAKPTENLQAALKEAAPEGVPASFTALWDYWLSIRKDAVCPSAADFDPMKIARLLPDVSVFERRSRHEVVYRLAGTAIGERMGHDPTGENVLELSAPERRSFLVDLFTEMTTRPVAAFVRYENIYASGRRATVQSLLLPLGLKSEETGNVAAPRILSIHTMGPAKAYAPAQAKTTVGSTVEEIAWIDIGAGTPAA